jgi:hypothetical protein
VPLLPTQTKTYLVKALEDNGPLYGAGPGTPHTDDSPEPPGSRSHHWWVLRTLGEERDIEDECSSPSLVYGQLAPPRDPQIPPTSTTPILNLIIGLAQCSWAKVFLSCSDSFPFLPPFWDPNLLLLRSTWFLSHLKCPAWTCLEWPHSSPAPLQHLLLCLDMSSRYGCPWLACFYLLCFVGLALCWTHSSYSALKKWLQSSKWIWPLEI